MNIFQVLTIKKRLIYITFGASLIGIGGMVALAVQPPKPVKIETVTNTLTTETTKYYPLLYPVTRIKEVEKIKYIKVMPKKKPVKKRLKQHVNTSCPVVSSNDANKITFYFNKK